MKTAIMQPYIYPYMGYYQLIHSVDKFIILDDVNFIKKGWIHRNNLSDGKLFTIPIIKASQNKKINDTMCMMDELWVKKFYNRIEHLYSKSRNYEIILPLLKKDIKEDSKNISSLNFKTLKTFCEYLEIKTEIIESSSIYSAGSLKGQDRIIDICKKEKTQTYINAIGGRDLYEHSVFESRGLNLKFIKTNFVSYDSMLTLFMTHDKEYLISELNNYELQ